MLLTFLRNLISLLFKHGDKSQPNVKKERSESKTLYQVFISLGPLICVSGVGGMMGFSGIFLPQLKEEDSRIRDVDSEVGSWIAASAVLPLTVFPFVGGFLMEKIGRKWAHILPSIPAIIGWITISLSGDISTVLIGRVLTGISCGLCAPITMVYIGETTSPSLRPFLSGGVALFLNLGTFLCHLVGTFLIWETTALFCLIFPLIGALLTLFSPESPKWSIDKNRVDEGIANFKKIRGESEKNMNELNVILEKHKNRKDGEQTGSLWNTLHSRMTSPEVFKPLLILVLYFISVQLAGTNVVTFYAISIVQRSLGPNFSNTYLVMILMDFIRMVTSILACVLIKKYPRRHIVLIGGSATFVCLLVLSISTYFSEIYPGSQIFVYAPLLALLGYVFFISISLVPLPWCLAGELLPQDVKGLASGIFCSASFTAFFTSIKCSPFLFNNLGTAFTYLLFSSSALFGTVLCYFFLPETQNKTLNEIADMYRKEKSGKV